MTIKSTLKNVVLSLGYEIRRIKQLPRFKNIPNADLYRPYYSPWFSDAFARHYATVAPRTLVTIDSCYILHTLLNQALAIEGDVWECGVYRGGTAALFANTIAESGAAKKLYLFDTFTGMPATDETRDLHKKGDFSDTSAETVLAYINSPNVAVLRKGYIPDTFSGLESHRIAFAHIDLDIYKSVNDSLNFIWPRLSIGGFIVIDDYGFPSCPGARQAVDEFFAKTYVRPLCLGTAQAIVFKSGPAK